MYYNVLDDIFTDISPKQGRNFRIYKNNKHPSQKIKEESIASIHKKKNYGSHDKREEIFGKFHKPL